MNLAKMRIQEQKNKLNDQRSERKKKRGAQHYNEAKILKRIKVNEQQVYIDELVNLAQKKRTQIIFEYSYIVALKKMIHLLTLSLYKRRRKVT